MALGKANDMSAEGGRLCATCPSDALRFAPLRFGHDLGRGGFRPLGAVKVGRLLKSSTGRSAALRS